MYKADYREEKVMRAGKVLHGLQRSLERCDLCARECGVNRLKGEKGFCSSGAELMLYSYGPHHGEEPPLSGKNGSGTIFFSHCSMACVYCQNHKFSYHGAGKTITIGDLRDIMLELQDIGCHNINLVSPTHYVPPIVEALRSAWSVGLELPVVYNTGGYDSPHIIKDLEGLVDIYLTDMRYASDSMSTRYSSAPGYMSNNRAIVSEMFRQTGTMEISQGLAHRGLIIRLLMLPDGISGTAETLEFISREIGKDVYLSVMSQYYPVHKALSYKEIARKISRKEHERVTEKMCELGFHKGWVQPFESEFDKDLTGENLQANI
ncbi:MAG: radical SAM protein [Candidatus Omnitrophota bacterium]|nr:radical SAM protein [Candidatus Omnitrophota bacterium]